MRVGAMNKKPNDQDPLRTTAEKKLARAPKPKPKPKPASAEELLHELQVHQIELEMQNEQLRQAQVVIEEMRDRYVDLFEFAPVGYITLTRAGTISDVNLTGAALLGVERKKLLNRRFAHFVSTGDNDQWNKHFLNLLQRDRRQNCELALKRGDGSCFPARITSLLRPDDSPSAHQVDDLPHLPGKTNASPLLRITITDITEGKRTEENLRKSEERWAFAIEGSGDGVWDWDLQTGKVIFSGRYKEMLGHAGDEAWGSLDEWKSRVNGEDMHHAMQELEAYMDGKRAVYTAEYRMRCKDGGWKWMLVRGMVMGRAADGRPLRMIGTHTDITAHKQAAQQLRNLTAHLQSVREEEKASIAREIHDDLGSTLTSMKMETYWLKTELAKSKKASPLLNHVWEISKLIDHASGAMRNIITGLRPAILDDLGLCAALEWKAGQFQKHTGIKCRVNCAWDNGGLDKSRSAELFRISQEALANVARHSGASSVEIEYHHNDEEIILSVTDNGRGMMEKRTDTSMHYGIMGMCERVGQMGGKISFNIPPGGGLDVMVILPPQADKKEQT